MIVSILFFIEYLCNKIKYRQFMEGDNGVVYENSKFIFINKPPDIKINSNDKIELTVQTYMSTYYHQYANETLTHQFYFPHRLDYSTSGILCLPKQKEACKRVSRLFRTRVIKKYYVAVLRGIMANDVALVDKPIGDCIYEPETRRMCTSDNICCANPRDALTVILKVEEGFYEGYPGTKVLIRTITGRRHQIRVHCYHLGHTIVGDYTYSFRKDVKPMRMFLHSVRLILPCHYRNIDVKTEDPFTCDKNKNWITTRTFYDLDNAYNKINEIVEHDVKSKQTKLYC